MPQNIAESSEKCSRTFYIGLCRGLVDDFGMALGRITAILIHCGFQPLRRKGSPVDWARIRLTMMAVVEFRPLSN